MGTSQLNLKPVAADASEDAKYDLRVGVELMSGVEALARLPLERRWRDQDAGLNTAGFISGYRGSPLGGYDQELWRIADRLESHHIKFQPGVNEDLAATAVWGTQYVNLYPGAKVDGVFGIWYGKSPGVDRSGDAFQHANTAGTAPKGGVIALVGDDHAAKSSSRAGQSDLQLKACGMPILYPSNVQEILDYGLHGIEMSRFSGCWVGVKLVTDVVETSGMVDLSDDRLRIQLPDLPTMPAGGLHIRTNEPPLEMEARLYEHKIPAAIAYARANDLNRIVLAPARPKVGVISAGKSWNDVRSALLTLGLDDGAAAEAGLRLLKLGMTWPLDPKVLQDFASGLECILVVEEKRSFVEEQVKAILFGDDSLSNVRVIGKTDPLRTNIVWKGELPLAGELSPGLVAKSIAAVLGMQEGPSASLTVAPAGPVRMPNFCSGCPHNSSTVVPEGSRTLAGIGCHGMAMWIRPENTSTVSHMGAEGMFWVGQSHFTSEKHVFVNLGDGTFFHSGSLALRQAIAARMRVTYKILFNGYISMTGGQPHDGDLTVGRVIDIVRAEGVGRIVIVADDVTRYDKVALPAGIAVHPRTQLDDVQRALREYDGVSVLVYDQTCAAELRRIRKKDPTQDIAKRTIIHPEVCEGCGDCGTRSNCMSVEPLETELGRKRQINQSSCNKDFSCVEGFCPSFVTVHGGSLKSNRRLADSPTPRQDLPLPRLPAMEGGYNLLLAGIGGTGIVTVAAILGKAAHLDGIAASVLDLTGMSQKYGAVMSHVRFAAKGALMPSARIGIGEVDTVIGCDLVVVAGQEALGKLASGRSVAVVNTALIPTSEFTKNPDWSLGVPDLLERVRGRIGEELHALDAGTLATALMGDAIAINMFLVGFAWQLGRIPISMEAIHSAIERNHVAVDFNKRSFAWGRFAAVDLAAVERQAFGGSDRQLIRVLPGRLHKVDEIIADRARRLTDYQDAAYANRYRRLLQQVQDKDAEIDAQGRLARAVARNYYKLLANKDEFEVARLFSTASFREQVARQFDGDYKLHFHLGAWPFASRDARGRLRKREFGPWMLGAMRVLQHLRRARGTWLDPFRNTLERQAARELLVRYEADLDLILGKATEGSRNLAVELAELPDQIRGFGHVREAASERLHARRSELRVGVERPQS